MFFRISLFYKQCYITLRGFAPTKKGDLLGPYNPCTMAHTSLSPYGEGEHMGAQHSHARTMWWGGWWQSAVWPERAG
jgi:hypothetical protein